jgi:hypothetical protein
MRLEEVGVYDFIFNACFAGNFHNLSRNKGSRCTALKCRYPSDVHRMRSEDERTHDFGFNADFAGKIRNLSRNKGLRCTALKCRFSTLDHRMRSEVCKVDFLQPFIACVQMMSENTISSSKLFLPEISEI